ncbi:MAG: aspartate/glutamate racemase family protein [Candidatus Bipolaricaulota bacterium]
MKILVVNPNSSVEMTQSIREALERIRRPDTVVEVVRLENGPSSIESATDGAMSTPLLLDRIRWANQEGFDAIIVACFSDPGLEPAREVSGILVLGIQQTTLAIAATLGHKYSILTPLSSRIASKEQDVRRFRVDSACASVRALDLSVSQTEGDPELTKRRVKEVARAAIEQDGAEVIILGCAGMVGYAEELERDMGIVVLDPTSVTFKVTEGLVELGIRHSKRGLFHTPPERSQD